MKCKGCGIDIQYGSADAWGYSPKLNSDLCQRCFRLQNYGDLNSDVKHSILVEDVLKEVEKLPGLVLWFVDLFDLPASLKLPINRYLAHRSIVLVATKEDLLPATLSKKKLLDFLNTQLKENNIEVAEIVIIGDYGKNGLSDLYRAIKTRAIDKKVILLGNANTGKSTALKALTKENITVSSYPGTTLAVSAYHSDDYCFYDTPGLLNRASCLQYIDAKDLHYLIAKPQKSFLSYQIFQEQSFAVGGLVRIDFQKVKKATVVFYCAKKLKIHRRKIKGAQEFWQQHYGGILKPIIGRLDERVSYHYKKGEDKIDICIDGLGFIALSGEIESFTVTINKNIDVMTRKGMI